MREAADACRVSIVTGDTKVVDRGKADGLFVTTAGVGVVPEGVRIEPSRIRSGDAVVLSGDVGRHGIAVLAVREGLAFESALESDCAPLADAVAALLEAGVDVHALRDLTRGGLASAVVELAESARVTIRLVEDDIDVIEPVRGACEILGLDPLYVANEGRFVAFVPFGQADRAVQALRSAPVSAGARVIGRVEEGEDALVMLRSRVGASRVVDLLSGEQLPRIC
jgi:hydrogenase expression/formation protein HypE